MLDQPDEAFEFVLGGILCVKLNSSIFSAHTELRKFKISTLDQMEN